MEFITITGPEFENYIETVATLRLTIFKEYPYLYDGTIQTEKNYLKNYARSKNSLTILVKDGEKIVGAITGMPLVEMEETFVTPFYKNQLPIHPFYYLGEVLLFKEYRGQGIEKRLYNTFEEWLKNKNEWSKIAVAELKRDKNDPRRPKDYVDMHDFWESLGFKEHPEVILEMPYKEIGSKEVIPHSLIFLFKQLAF